jgi:aminoglycoside phosphotransferase (APT) family kinase protein
VSDLRDDLTRYLADQMPERSGIAITSMTRMPEGWSRECFSFTVVSTDADSHTFEQDMILRRDPEGSLVYTDRQLEFAVVNWLHGLGFAVPAAPFLSTSKEVLGAPFMIMEKLSGVSSPSVLLSDEYAGVRDEIGRQFVAFLADLHAVDHTVAELPFAQVPDVTTAADAAIDHWERTLHEQQLEPHPFMAQAIRWFRNHKPVADRVSVLHGDYRVGNFLFDTERITGVVDWELTSLGDPLQDLGWAFMDIWRTDGRVCGFFTEDRTIELYEQYSGRTIDRDALEYWKAFAHFQLAVIGFTGARTRVDKRSDEINFSISHLYAPPLMQAMSATLGI